MKLSIPVVLFFWSLGVVAMAETGASTPESANMTESLDGQLTQLELKWKEGDGPKEYAYYVSVGQFAEGLAGHE